MCNDSVGAQLYVVLEYLTIYYESTSTIIDWLW